MGIGITSNHVVNLSCVLVVMITLHFDYLYVMLLIDNWDLYMKSEVGPRLMNLWCYGLFGYVLINMLVSLIVRWTWK